MRTVPLADVPRVTLVVVPEAHTCVDDMGGWVKRRVVSKERERQLREEQAQAGLSPEPALGD